MTTYRSPAPWMALKAVHGVGNITFRKLISSFETPEAVLGASSLELSQKAGISETLALRIKEAKIGQEILKEIELAEKSGIRIITFNDDIYPSALKEIADPPPYIYVYGNLLPDASRLAIVGSRNATFYGIEAANSLAKNLASQGIEIVSGMARGIDTSAHEGALSGNGRTIAVLGSGLKRIYPPENQKLFQKIAENGAVISEFPLAEGPDAKNFPKRNRIICGISSGVVVVEAGEKSGSLITARLAAEQGREVFAVPGSINSSRSSGTHALLKQGARLVTDIDDILDELPYLTGKKISGIVLDEKSAQSTENLSEDEVNLMGRLDVYPQHIDEVGRKSGLAPGKVSCILLELELKGLVNQLPGKLYVLNEDKNWLNR